MYKFIANFRFMKKWKQLQNSYFVILEGKLEEKIHLSSGS